MSSRPLVGTVLMVALVTLPACQEPNDLGQVCFFGAISDFDAGILRQDPWDNPDCLSGLCLKQDGYRCDDGSATCPDPGAQEKLYSICTHACETNADCVGSSDNVNDCRAYVCQRTDSVSGMPVPCHCACLDYIRDGDGITLPQAAFDASDLACTPQ